MKLREEIENNFEAILKEIRTNKSISTVTKPRSNTNEFQNTKPSGSKSIGIAVRASNVRNSDSEDDDHLRVSDLREEFR